MDFALIGYLAGTCTTLSFVPQVWRAWRTRNTDDIAWAWLIVFQFGLTLWFAYGVVLRNWPMILANFTTMTLCSLLMVIKFVYTKRQVKLAKAGAGH
jgi:MtN3 and saliva related transmembrane protein